MKLNWKMGVCIAAAIMTYFAGYCEGRFARNPVLWLGIAFVAVWLSTRHRKVHP